MKFANLSKTLKVPNVVHLIKFSLSISILHLEDHYALYVSILLNLGCVMENLQHTIFRLVETVIVRFDQ
jgi:hypothetical protein